MAKRYWFLLLGVLVASVALDRWQKHRFAERVGVVLEAVFPKRDPESLKARVTRFMPARERGTLEVAVTPPREVDWVGLEATARFEPWPTTCQRYSWGIGYRLHVESVALPVEARDGRFLVRLEQAPAPADLYGNGLCSWDLKELQFSVTGEDIYEGIPGASATFILPGGLLRGRAPATFVCRPEKRDGKGCGLLPVTPDAEGPGILATIKYRAID